jgi:caffeoyl-CoA O-methyltransferase
MAIVDESIEEYLLAGQRSKEPVLREMEARAQESEFPIIGPLVGRLCQQVALAISARDIFEMGSGFGYSTWWFAQAVGAQGRVVHTDGDPKKSQEAKSWLRKGGLHTRVQFEVGDAREVIKAYPGPFDIVFIDIDKEGYPDALELARSRVRPGGYIIADNVLWSGKVTQPAG